MQLNTHKMNACKAQIHWININVEDATDSQGYKRKFGYMATQMPLPNTIVDFWRLVFDMDLRAIIMLNILTDDMVQDIFLRFLSLWSWLT